jgi:hypothetical protein
VALLVRDLLDGLGLASWPKTSGARGSMSPCPPAQRAPTPQPSAGDPDRLRFTPTDVTARIGDLGDLHAPVASRLQRIPLP